MINGKIKLGVSIKNYETKPDFVKVRYKVKEINQEEFIYSIQHGYSFTHSMKVVGEYGCKEKTINNFDQTNYIWIDFDHCFTPLDEVWNKLQHKPSIGYTTISNSTNDYRFRLIYLIDFKINSNEDYKYYLNILLNDIIDNIGKDYLKIIDNKCFNVSQQMFGSNQNCTLISSDIIYDINFFNNYNNLIINYIDNKCSKKLNDSICEAGEKTLTVNANITTLMNELKNINITHYQPIFSNKYNAILDGNNIYTYVEDQSIYEIKFFYSITDKKYKKIPIGNRNNILYTMALVTKNIEPEITLTDLAKNLYWIYQFRTEHSDDFTLKNVCEIAISAYKTDITNYIELGKRKYLINPEHKYLSKKEKAKALGEAKRRKRDEIIFSDYDSLKTVKENAEEIGYSTKPVRKALKEHGLSTPNQQKYEAFCVAIYENPDASIRQLAKLTGLSDKTIQTYKKRFFKE